MIAIASGKPKPSVSKIVSANAESKCLCRTQRTGMKSLLRAPTSLRSLPQDEHHLRLRAEARDDLLVHVDDSWLINHYPARGVASWAREALHSMIRASFGSRSQVGTIDVCGGQGMKCDPTELVVIARIAQISIHEPIGETQFDGEAVVANDLKGAFSAHPSP
jgi:hypothetical protein